jgi:hypothetical protein
MIPNKLIEAVVLFAFMAGATGQLPKLIRAVQVAQYEVLKSSKASTWKKLAQLPER